MKKNFFLIFLLLLLLKLFSFQEITNKAINICGRKELGYKIPNKKSDCEDPYVKNKFCCFVQVYKMKFCALLTKKANEEIEKEFNEKINITNKENQIKIECN